MAQHDTFDRVPSDWRELLLLDTALAFGIVDAIVVPVPAGELAARSGLDARATTAILDALVGLGYATCDQEGYRLTSDARDFLVDEDSGQFRRHSLAHNAHQLRRWMTLPQVVREGGPAPADPAEGRDLERFMGAMDDVSRPSAPVVVDTLLGAVPEARRVLDVGGGPGTYARELAHRGVATIVYDVPDVVELMTPRFADESLVEYLSGDVRCELPSGPFDGVLLANIVHIFGPETNRDLIARAAGAAAGGGVVAVFDFLLGVSPRAPMFAVNMLVATSEGRTYREGELRDWCEAAELTVESVTDFPEREEQLLIARKPG